MARLGNYIRQVRGVSYKPGDLFDGPSPDAITVLRANNITDSGEITLDDVVWVAKERVKEQQLIKAGDILVCASSGSKNLVGKAAQAEKDLDVAFEAFCKVVRPMNANKKYIGYFFQSPIYRRSISYASAGVNINNIRSEDLDALAIDLPDADEQAMRVKKLEKLARSIALRKKQLDKIDLLIKSQFIEMFGGYSLRDKQPHWRKIGNVAEVVGGSTPKTEKREFWGGNNCWITPAEIDDDSFIVKNTVRRLTDEGVKSCSLKRLPIGTVLLSSRAPIGKVAIAGVEMYCNQGFKNLICGQSLNSIYTYYLLKFNSEYLNSLGRGATFKEISKAIVDNIAIPVPEMERQNQFAAFVEQTDKSKVPFELEVAA